MDKDHFWLLVERGSYVATLFLGLAEMCQLASALLF